jgi:hypothetical protein
MLVVTKHPDWYRQNMSQWYADVTESPRKGYFVFRGVRPSD